MISGSKNLLYIARGVRTYGSKPVAGWPRGRWEFEFILKGRARPTGVQSPIPETAKPYLYISHPDSPHGWTDEQDGYSEIFVVQFQEVPPELAERADPTKPIMIELEESERRRFTARLEEVWESSQTSSAYASLKVQQLLVEMALLAVGRSGSGEQRSVPADKVFRALNWFEENIGENPSVEAAAEAVGVSAAHLRRLFVAAGKRSPQAELTRLRLEAAQRCLLAGWTQEAITQFLGFSEVSAFARAFRHGCGHPPRAWLARAR